MSGSLTETLSASSDAGKSQTDGDTRATPPTFIGTIQAGDPVAMDIVGSNGAT